MTETEKQADNLIQSAAQTEQISGLPPHPAAMETYEKLEDDPAVSRLFELFASNNQVGQALDLSRLVWHIDALERERSAMKQELNDVKNELRDTQAMLMKTKSATVEKFIRVIQTVEVKMDYLREQIHNARDKIASFAGNILEGIKQNGISMLDSAASVLHIRETLENIHDSVQESAASVKAEIEQAELIGAELRSAGNHLKNAGRAVIGKEIREADNSPEGMFQAVALAPMRAVHKTLSNINNTTLAAIGSVERLEQAAENNRPKHLRRKPSIRQALAEKKPESVLSTVSAPDKERKLAEAVI